MAKDNSPLAHLKIAAPCPSDWDSMMGNDQVRFCKHCDLSVYNLSAMTRRDAEILASKSKGRLCVRYFRRQDGSILTVDDTRTRPVNVHIRTGAFTVLLTLSSNVFCQTDAQGAKPESTQVTLSAEKKDTDPGQRPHTASVSGSVIAPDSAAIVGARVVILDQSKRQRRITTTDEQGTFQFTSLAPDVYFLEIAAEGFSEFTVSHLTLKNGDELRVDAQMRIGPLVCEVVEVRGNAVNGSADIGTVAIVRRKSIWEMLYEVATFPYRQGKKVFSR